MTDVKRLARWNGWCDPCEVERPLVLTESGQRGVRAWLRGLAAEDRNLILTCLVCGEWQHVPHDEDEVADVVDAPITALTSLRRLGARQVVVHAPTYTAYPIERVPAPRVVTYTSSASIIELLGEGLDLISLAS